MQAAGVDPVAIDVFSHYYRQLEHGETGLIPESSIEPLDMESIDDAEVDDEPALRRHRRHGRDQAQRRSRHLDGDGPGQVAAVRATRPLLPRRDRPPGAAPAPEYGATLPLMFMNSFRTSSDTLAALARYDDLEVRGLPLEFLQNKEPKLKVDDLRPIGWPRDPALEWCPPGPRRPLHRADGQRPLRQAHRRGLPPRLRLQRRQPRRRPRRAGGRLVRRSPGRRSPSRPCAAPPRTARAATSPAARPTAGSSCARPRRPPRPTARPCRTSTGTGSARPTTSGSTSSGCATRSPAATASSACR